MDSSEKPPEESTTQEENTEQPQETPAENSQVPKEEEKQPDESKEPEQASESKPGQPEESNEPDESGVVNAEEEQEAGIPEDFYYPQDHLEKRPRDSPISSELCKFHWCAGFDENKRNNLYFLSATEIVYAIGITYHIYNIETGEKQLFFGKDGKGIGALTVHPQQTHFAVGEKGDWPNIYVFEYPSLKLYRILRKGTEKAFSTMSWSGSGKMLATVGSEPDFLLTVWDWKQEKIILKSKAFGQEVYRVTFSPKFEEEIITSGTAHIRFWKMANTFTGLKLQGDIGKFGQVELSDVSGYVELPDSKVLSGTEYGNLLLWDGALVKAVIYLPEGKPCHDGSIESVILSGEEIMTAGTDGCVKWWDMKTLMDAEPEEGFEYEVPCKHSVVVGDHAEIVDLVKGNKLWLAVDKKGKIWKISEDFLDQESIMDFHAGKVMDVAISPECNAVVTIGEDCTTRLWDFVNKKEMYVRSWVGKGHVVSWVPPTERNGGKLILAGFDNGIIRLLYLGESNFEVIAAHKAHEKGVLRLEFSPDGQSLVSCAADNTLFFFEVLEDSSLEPVCLTQIEGTIRDIGWHSSSESVILGLHSGKVLEINRPNKISLDTAHSYLVELPQKSWTIKMMESQKTPLSEEDLLLPEEERPEEEEWDPAPVLSVSYHPNNTDNFIVAADSPYNGFLYECSFEEERPVARIPTTEALAQTMTVADNFFVTSHSDGSYQIRDLKYPEKYLSKRVHDGSARVRKTLLNKKQTFAVSVAEDGTLFASRVYPQEIFEAAKTGSSPKLVEESFREAGIEELDIAERPSEVVQITEDILDPSVYSIQEDKLKTDEDKKKSLAEMKKDRKRKEIAALKAEFEELLKENAQQEAKYQLDQEELLVDPEYQEMLLKRNENLLEEARKEVAWYEEYYSLALNKYKKYLLDKVEVERFKVHALSSSEYVTSFRVTKKSPFLLENLESVQELNDEDAKYKLGSMRSETESVLSPGKFSQFTVDQSEQQYEETKTEFKQTIQPREVMGETKKKSQAQENRERRNQFREERKTNIEKLKKQKPSSDIDPQDQQEISEAEANMGDFKLKTSPDYVVPKSLCVNASQKRKQMFLLMDSAHNLKMELNSRLLSLRDNKLKLVEWIKQKKHRINQINQELRIQEKLYEFKFHEEEWPEKFYEVSGQDIDNYLAKNQVLPESQNKLSGEISSLDSEAKKTKSKGMSDKEKTFKEKKDLTLLNEKSHIQTQIAKKIKQFDDALKEQKEQKLLLENDLKQIDMKLVIYYKELNLLNELEPEDQRLSSQMAKLQEDKLGLLNEISEINQEYEKHLKDQEEISVKHKEIYNEFNNKVEGTTCYKQLQAIFDRNKKRRKKGNADSDAEEDEEESAEESDSDSDSEDEEDDEEDKCPDDCGMDVFEDVIQLRERRLDLVEESNAKKQIINDLKRKQETIQKNEAKISHEIQKTEQEIQEFERDKMKRLNQISTSLILAQDQIQIVDEHNKLPPTLEGYVVFTNGDLEQLSERILQLKKEKQDEENQRKKLNLRMKEYERKKKEAEKKKDSARKKYEEIQKLRFGHAINLENLKYAQPSDQLAKLQKDFEKAEKEAVKRIEEAKTQLTNSREELKHVTARNTNLLDARSKLFQKIMKQNKALDVGVKDIYKTEESNKQEDFWQEEQRLQEAAELMSRKIAELKSEINLLRKKGGHVYTQITANRRANIG